MKSFKFNKSGNDGSLQAIEEINNKFEYEVSELTEESVDQNDTDDS
jgi:hypothetical protein